MKKEKLNIIQILKDSPCIIGDGSKTAWKIAPHVEIQICNNFVFWTYYKKWGSFIDNDSGRFIWAESTMEFEFGWWPFKENKVSFNLNGDQISISDFLKHGGDKVGPKEILVWVKWGDTIKSVYENREEILKYGDLYKRNNKKKLLKLVNERVLGPKSEKRAKK